MWDAEPLITFLTSRGEGDEGGQERYRRKNVTTGSPPATNTLHLTLRNSQTSSVKDVTCILHQQREEKTKQAQTSQTLFGKH